MRLAAIDIGSNAIRLQITKVIEYEQLITFKKLQYVRFPLRLGHDVFTHKYITEANQEKFLKLMGAYKNLIDLYEVDHYFGCATSAMRESKNGKELTARTLEETGVKINIISGAKEAEMINSVISLDLDDKTYLHIDVGGGSTELNFYYKQKKVISKSFKIGSVRRLEHHDSPKVWKEIEAWVKEQLKGHKEKVTAIGTGGNINKIYELSPRAAKRKMSLNSVMRVQDYLRNLTLEERLNRLQLNPDRADVIIPASEIYVHAMLAANASSIVVPDVGLKDGINYYLFDKYYPSRGKIFVKNS
ncbi:Ppx/GppA phosphatase family protein [Marinoscillum furvescens]|uniref:Exopolyphosphatase/guanosine-5'-triphosphate, 3'-diphosphate pyrophosphatase n=1 Tax=Marinoscillum furvescens DSM 4134 TaxID=1122208 RepID=A0A3D9KZ78_MARFU|nr:phosphatase [Marinoscillum furvescens]RED95599.1 exopolyphosphatase/guanosine-5'-triphosphate,3'-diphosphate pyrophosphatase [Marinoscillum furvescens DSM 4134]